MKTLNIKKLENALGITFSNENLLPVNVNLKFWSASTYQVQIFNSEKVEGFFIYTENFKNHKELAQHIEKRAIWIICRLFTTDNLCKDEPKNKSNYDILFSIDRFFFAQYRANKLDCGYFSNYEENNTLLIISDLQGRSVNFKLNSKKLIIYNMNSEFGIPRDLLIRELDNLGNFSLLSFYSNLVAVSQFFVEINQLNNEPKRYKTQLTSLTARQVRKLGVIPNPSVYYFRNRFVGKFYAPSKNMVRKINNRLGL